MFRRNGGSNWLSFRCKYCNSPAIPTNGTVYWCPRCGWVYKTNGISLIKVNSFY